MMMVNTILLLLSLEKGRVHPSCRVNWEESQSRTAALFYGLKTKSWHPVFSAMYKKKINVVISLNSQLNLVIKCGLYTNCAICEHWHYTDKMVGVDITY